MDNHYFLLPLYNDWESFSLLLKKINDQMNKSKNYADVIVVDDCSKNKFGSNAKYVRKFVQRPNLVQTQSLFKTKICSKTKFGLKQSLFKTKICSKTKFCSKPQFFQRPCLVQNQSLFQTKIWSVPQVDELSFITTSSITRDEGYGEARLERRGITRGSTIRRILFIIRHLLNNRITFWFVQF